MNTLGRDVFPARAGAWLVVAALLALALPARAQTAAAAETPNPGAPGVGTGWRTLFDGKSLAGWAQSGFEAEGPVKVANPFRDGRGAIVIEKGMTLSGFTWTRGGELPRVNYELTLEAMKLAGGDFFCGLTFPVAKSACTFVVGGWGGNLVGISSIDNCDASENETTTGLEFTDNRWYRITVRVTDDRIVAWIDDEKMVDFETKGRTIGLRPGDIQKSLPLGVASYMTRAAIRDIRLRRL